MLWIPLLPLVGGIASFAVGLAAGREAIIFVVIGVGAFAWGLFAARKLTRTGDRLHLVGVGTREELGADAAFGYRTVGSGRSVSIEVYANDGRRTVVLWSMMPTTMAAPQRTTERLTRSLAAVANPKAAQQVAEQMRPMLQAQKTVEEYYASPKHRRVGLYLVVGVAVYSLVMALVFGLG